MVIDSIQHFVGSFASHSLRRNSPEDPTCARSQCHLAGFAEVSMARLTVNTKPSIAPPSSELRALIEEIPLAPLSLLVNRFRKFAYLPSRSCCVGSGEVCAKAVPTTPKTFAKRKSANSAVLEIVEKRFVIRRNTRACTTLLYHASPYFYHILMRKRRSKSVVAVIGKFNNGRYCEELLL